MRPAAWPIRSLARGTSKLPREMPWRSASWNRPRRRYAARSRLLLCARRVSARSSFLLMTCRLDWSCACWRAPPRSAGLAVDTSPKRVCPWHRRSGVPTQMPAAHRSFVVHGLPSSHTLVLYAYAQPVAGSQTSSVQGLPSLQTSGIPSRHAPVVGSQVSTPLHASPSSQTTGAPTQMPAAHASFVVHGLPSSQKTVLLGVCMQPSVSSQVSSVQGLPSSQLGGVPGTHPPVVGSQLSMPLHACPSSQSTYVPRQTPFWHTSFSVHGLPSSHVTVALGVYTQPCAGSQVSSVHVLLSSQTGGVPGRHAPVVGSQVSAPLHASWSSHAAIVPCMQSPFTQVSAPSQSVLFWQSASETQHIGMKVLSQPETGLQVSSAQMAPLAQLGGVPATQPAT